MEARAFLSAAAVVLAAVAGCTSSHSSIPGGHDACATDDDCTIAQDATDCGAGCPDAYSKAHVAAEHCLVAPHADKPSGCGACQSGDDSVSLVCYTPPRVACVSGSCTAQGDCLAGFVPLIVGEDIRCVPACKTHDDCVIVQVFSGCCAVGGCASVAPRGALGAEPPCLVDVGQEPPASCVTCAPAEAATCAIATCKPSAAVCMQGGSCQSSTGGCPKGYVDSNGVCVPAPDGG